MRPSVLQPGPAPALGAGRRPWYTGSVDGPPGLGPAPTMVPRRRARVAYWPNGVGPRIENPALMMIAPYPWAAPVEELRLKKP